MHKNTSGSSCAIITKNCTLAANTQDSSMIRTIVLWGYECWQENAFSTMVTGISHWRICHSPFPTDQVMHTFFLQILKIGYSSSVPYWCHKLVHPRRVNFKNKSRNGICELPFQFMFSTVFSHLSFCLYVSCKISISYHPWCS